MARVVLLRVCPSLHPLQTLLYAAFCALAAVVSGLLPVVRDHRMIVPVGHVACPCVPGLHKTAPWFGLAPVAGWGVTLACFSRPTCCGSLSGDIASSLDAPDLLILVSCWGHDLTSLLATPTLSSLDSERRHAIRPIADLLSKQYDTVQPLGSRWTRP
jgi:hypothetical protein